jgi:hypothetical protein
LGLIVEDINEYEVFVKSMEEKYPKMLDGKYGGFAIGKGWWIIVDKLMGQIQWHIDNSVKNNKWDLENDKTDVRPIIPQVTVAQIKEKFGGLRFYYDGGDEYIHGLVSMAESWAGIACEECGGIGERRSGGWIRTLCDKHEAEHQEKHKLRNQND